MVGLNKILGAVLAERRRTVHLSQEDLAFECDLHPTYISQIERGLKSPTVRTLFLIAKVLDTKPSKLLHKVEQKFIASTENS